VAKWHEFKDGTIWDVCVVYGDMLYMYISVNLYICLIY